MYGYFVALTIAAAFWLAVRTAILAARRRGSASDYEAGRQALRDGLPLNVGWSSRKRAGWADQWHETARERATSDLRRKLNVETDR